MKILITVEFYSPSIGGAQEAARQIAEHLTLLNNDVTVATTKLSSRNSRNINGVKIKEFNLSGNFVRGYTGNTLAYQNYLRKSNFDVIINYAAQQWATDLMLPILGSIKSKKIIIPCGFSGLYEPVYSEYYKLMRTWLGQYDASVYLSHNYRDINFAKYHNIKNLKVIPNGADEREFLSIKPHEKAMILKKYKLPANNRLITCISNHTGQKGHAEAIESFKKSKVKNTSLVFIGDINLYGGCYKDCLDKSKRYNFLSRIMLKSNNTINLINTSRSGTLDLLSNSDLFLFLSNIEASPLVLFEAAAAGIPSVVSDCGNSKEIIKWLQSGVIAKTTIDKKGISHAEIYSAAKLIRDCIGDSMIRSRIGNKARRNWKRKFTWEKIALQYNQLCTNITRGKYEGNKLR